MTISSTELIDATHTISGQGPYSFSFEVIDEADVVAYRDEVLIPSGYTIALNGSGPIHDGGTLTFDDPSPDPGTLRITRMTPQDQQTDYQPYDRFPAETHEFALDKLTLIAQELQKQIDEA